VSIAGVYDEGRADTDSGNSWKIAVPIVAGTILLLQRSMIYRYIKSLFQRRRISNWRRRMTRERRSGSSD
jgi:hypothetical protein